MLLILQKSDIVALEMFGKRASGVLVPIHRTDPRRGPWEHRAFVPYLRSTHSMDHHPRDRP